MAPKVPIPSFRSKGVTSRPPHHTQSSSSATKRPRIDGTSSSPVVIESDDETQTTLSSPSSKRTKVQRARNVSVPAHDSNSSDDEPLINHVTALSRPQGIGSMNQLANKFNIPSLLRPVASFETAQRASADARLWRDEVDHAETPEHRTPKTPTTKGSVHSKKTNLVSSFQSASSVAKPPSNSHLFTANLVSQQKVSSSEQLFTNTGLQEVNKLILSAGRGETGGNTDRSTRPRRSPNQGSNDSDMSHEGLPVVQSVEMPEEATFEIFEDTEADESSDESDGTLVGDTEDKHAASPVAARSFRMDKENISPPPPRTGRILAGFLHQSMRSVGVSVEDGRQYSSVDRAAPSPPAAEVIDLTDNEPAIARPIDPIPATPGQGLSLAEQLFPKPPTPPLSTELPKTTAAREIAFLRGVTIQWWAGGLSPRAATRNVNAALAPRIPRFSEEEGNCHLLALIAKGKLAIRHGLVYHNDSHPGPDAPKPTPTPSRQRTHVTSRQQLRQGRCDAETSQHRSPFGKISEHRFHVFEMKLHSAVKMEKTLFQGGPELVERCVKVLNECMCENLAFTEKEVSAAFASLAMLGKVEFEGDVVAMLALD